MKHNFQDLTDQRFGKLVVLRMSHTDSCGHTYWLCQCECDNKTTIRSDALKLSIACGCQRGKGAKARAWRLANPERAKATQRAYCKANPEKVKATQRAKYLKNPEKWKAITRASHASLSDEFYQHYGSACVGTCDGSPCEWQVTNREALTVGHLFNDGKAHRARVGSRTAKVIYDLKKRNWPTDEGIAPQCNNCQLKDMRRMVRKSVDIQLEEAA